MRLTRIDGDDHDDKDNPFDLGTEGAGTEFTIEIQFQEFHWVHAGWTTRTSDGRQLDGLLFDLGRRGPAPVIVGDLLVGRIYAVAVVDDAIWLYTDAVVDDDEFPSISVDDVGDFYETAGLSRFENARLHGATVLGDGWPWPDRPRILGMFDTIGDATEANPYRPDTHPLDDPVLRAIYESLPRKGDTEENTDG